LYGTDLLQHVQDRFSIALSDKLKLSFVHLHEHVALLQAAPFLSMVLESWGSLRLAWRGLARSHARGRVPHVWIDTTGCAFTYLPAVLLYGCTVVAYVHYPTISTDMLRLVWERPRRASYNHAAEISNSRWKTAVKVIYYSAFALAYGAVGSLATCVMVNSTWTYHHIRFLWKGAAWRGALSIVYPPCNVADLQALARPQTTTTPRQPVILSIGQFRPEKDHSLQLQAVAKLFQDHPSLQTAQPPVKLVMVGGCRNAADDARLAHLKELATTLGIADRVTFCVNQPDPVVRNWLSQAKVGLHTMWNEHFGIGIVEMMAAGLLTVAHNSGGPATDLIVPGQTGFLAATVDEYATALFQALTMKPEESQRMQEAACQSSARFSDQVFRESFRKALVDSKVL
jgi:alpha-1,2-mannosyltransferase